LDKPITVNLVICHTRLSRKLLSTSVLLRDEALKEIATWARWDPQRARMAYKSCSNEVEIPFQQRHGYIPRGGDVLVATMTVEEAKMKCTQLPSCLGFTFRGAMTADPVQVHFKNKDNIEGEGWTTFLIPKHGERDLKSQRIQLELVGQVMSFLENTAWEDEMKARGEMRRQLELMEKEALLQVVPMLVNVWPECVDEVVECMSSRLLVEVDKVPSHLDGMLVRLLAKMAPKGDKHAVDAFCACLERSPQREDFYVAAAKALQLHAPKGHRRAVLSLRGALSGVPPHASIPKALASIAPKGDKESIDALEAVLDKCPTSFRKAINAAVKALQPTPPKKPIVKRPSVYSCSSADMGPGDTPRVSFSTPNSPMHLPPHMLPPHMQVQQHLQHLSLPQHSQQFVVCMVPVAMPYPQMQPYGANAHSPTQGSPMQGSPTGPSLHQAFPGM
jgi:hypothetical protein